MGVPGLWKELAPAAKVRSLTELAVTEGFEANPKGYRGFRVGIDASIWFFHAAYGKEGENPELRTMFFRCATLTHAPFLPLFVFDGPRRPNVKRGKSINRTSHTLTEGMKRIVESFGFEWKVAPGEAEAELAYLNRIGFLDGILSDDVDNFLFGATTVIRNPSNNLSGNRANPVLNSIGKDDKNHTRVYRIEDISTHPEISFTRGDMILIGLCSGGDYDTSGMTGCGPAIAKALVRYGFGRSLYEAAKNLTREQLPAFLHNWRNEIRHELRTDSKGFIGSKRRALASSLPDAFPDIDILLSYVNPLTSESAGRGSNHLKLTWAKEPDLGELAATCEFYFEWGYRDAIIKRFKTVIWPGIVLRVLRRGVLDMERKCGLGEFAPSTPTKNGKPSAQGTPSKMITKHFSSLSLNPVDNDDDDRLITKITRTRTHVSTDGILEYRVEIRPRQFVLLAESGIQNTRRPLDADEWAGLTESGNEGPAETAVPMTAEERREVEEKEILVWVPASIVRMAEPRIVEEFEKKEEEKRLKKAGKGTAKRQPKAKASAPMDEESLDAPQTKPRKKAVRKPKAVVRLEEEEESDADALPRFKSPPKKAKAKAKAASTPDSSESSADELPRFLNAKVLAKGKAKDPPELPVRGESDPFYEPPARPEPIIRDLTKGKNKAPERDLKNFFPLANARARAKASTSIPSSAPLRPTKYATAAVDNGILPLSAPTPRRQELRSADAPISGPSKAPPCTTDSERREMLESAISLPSTPSGNKRAKKAPAPAHSELSEAENTSIAPKMVPRPFPLFDDTPPSRSKLARRKPSTSSDSDSRESRINKSPRKSAQHISPREKGVLRAASPTPQRLRAPTTEASKYPVIDISSDSDAPSPPPRPKARRPAAKPVLQPSNVVKLGNDIIDLSDL